MQFSNSLHEIDCDNEKCRKIMMMACIETQASGTSLFAYKQTAHESTKWILRRPQQYTLASWMAAYDTSRPMEDNVM